MIRRALVWTGIGVAAVALGTLLHTIAPQWGHRLAFAPAVTRGDAYFQQNDNARAVACWQVALDALPDARTVRNKLVVLHMNEGRFDTAGALLEEGLRRRPRTVSFLYNLALLRTMQGRLTEALAAAEQVEAINPMHGEIHFLKGTIYEKLGQNDLARQEFIHELNVDPATPEAWRKLLTSEDGAAMALTVQPFGARQ